MIELFANRGDPEQMPQNAVSDLVLHCLPNGTVCQMFAKLPLLAVSTPDYNGLIR